jgi:hypothetical protein
MSDVFSRISNINPTYPVRPVQPPQKDGESDKRKKERPKTDLDADENVQDDLEIRIDVTYDTNDDKPAIDEYV